MSGQSATAVRTEIVLADGHHRLLRDGAEYMVRGAGVGSTDPRVLDQLARRGGNSLRTWTTQDVGPLLDRAQQLGLTVTLGLNMVPQRHGFDYDCTEAVNTQLHRIRADVLQYRHHPALLAWLIGNELNLEHSNPRVYDAVNEVARMIHDLDPYHPVSTTTAGLSPQLAEMLQRRAPDLDFISVQFYGALPRLPRILESSRISRPFMVTEWGTVGHWEVPRTPWGAPIEPTSSQKADVIRRMHDQVLKRLPSSYLGSHVFLWGQKQERTPTWYGMFLATGESTEAVDVMQTIWTGAPPANRAPRIEPLSLDGRLAEEGIELAALGRARARVIAQGPDGDRCRFRWELRAESTATEIGGDPEIPPPIIDAAIRGGDDDEIIVMVPGQPGAYRLFVYVDDGRGHAAHANVPFRVR